jgi:UDP-galactopyranose mutase
MPQDWIIVGAGLVGCTLAEQIATNLNQRVLIVDTRNHVGGNVFDEFDQHGILVHRYGLHAFHTNDARIYSYLSRFTAWRRYEHKVLAEIDRCLVPVPFNLNSLDALFPTKTATLLRTNLLAIYGPGQQIPIFRLCETRDRSLRRLAEFVYEKLFYGYTVKQWGLAPEQLGPAVMGRVPVRISRDDRYFLDRYQGIPVEGYTAMIQNMLALNRIEVALNTSFESIRGTLRNEKVIFTGPIDSYFDYIHGVLPYRTLQFECEHSKEEYLQPVAQINYPNQHAYTRIIEHKHVSQQTISGTTITREYALTHQPGKTEPYYPIPCDDNSALYRTYAEEAARLQGRVFFAGRLADYKYYNMDQAVARALWLFQHEITKSMHRPHSLSGKASIESEKVAQDLYPVHHPAPVSVRIRKALRMIEAEYRSSELNLESVSQQVGITKHHLCRVFRREMGMGVPDYICRMRLRSAEQLLQDGMLSIKEIAAAIGFNHVAQLDRVFKTAHGCCPKEYRRKSAMPTIMSDSSASPRESYRPLPRLKVDKGPHI